jgi:hypothetical protein
MDIIPDVSALASLNASFKTQSFLLFICQSGQDAGVLLADPGLIPFSRRRCSKGIV